MAMSRRYGKIPVISIFLAGTLLIFSATAWAQDIILPNAHTPRKLQLAVGKSIVITSPKPIKRISEPAPSIASTLAVSPYQVYITGKAPGLTNLVLWKNHTDFTLYDLEVTYDITQLKEKLHDILPDEKDLRVAATQSSITLSGKISSSSNLSQAMALAQAYAPKGNIHNLLEVGGVHQVMLEVRVAEMSRSLVRDLGFNFSYMHGAEFSLGTIGSLASVEEIPANGAFTTLVSPAVNALFRVVRGGTSAYTGFVDLLKTDGLVKILAEPTLIALSGQTANFLAGGEFPVPVPQGLGTVAIEYKPFGVGLSFTPTVLSENKISMKVVPEVSELDFTTKITLQGAVVPGLSTRRTSTVVELGDGQSFAIAGLLRESVRDAVDKYPLLGDIPILGALFKSRQFQRNETELIIIITPHLVKPLDMAKQTLPTDFYIEPSDAEFYLLGLMQGREEKSEPSTPRGELEGEFGHAMPLLK